jgi:hypothetical protein
MIPGHYDIPIKQGDDWEMNVYVEEDDGSPRNLTGYVAFMHIRARVEAGLEKELSTSSGITITGATGLLAIKMAYSETALLTFRRGVYDLHLHKSGSPDIHACILEGDVVMSQLVTRGVTWP